MEFSPHYCTRTVCLKEIPSIPKPSVELTNIALDNERKWNQSSS